MLFALFVTAKEIRPVMNELGLLAGYFKKAVNTMPIFFYLVEKLY